MIGPGERYRVALEVLAAIGGETFKRHSATHGYPAWSLENPPPEAGLGPTYRVVVDEACSLVLQLNENGLTVRVLKLLGATRALIKAVVMSGPGAPEWLPTESSYLLFDGDRAAAATFGERYIPFDGVVTERTWPFGDSAPLDRLAVAVGRSVARANEVLARTRAEAGVALVSSITLRVAVQQVDVGQGRVLVHLARGGEAAQFVELTMTTVPGASEASPVQAAPGFSGAVAGAAGAAAGTVGDVLLGVRPGGTASSGPSGGQAVRSTARVISVSQSTTPQTSGQPGSSPESK